MNKIEQFKLLPENRREPDRIHRRGKRHLGGKRSQQDSAKRLGYEGDSRWPPLRQGSTDLLGHKAGEADPCPRIVECRNEGVLKLNDVRSRFFNGEPRQSKGRPQCSIPPTGEKDRKVTGHTTSLAHRHIERPEPRRIRIPAASPMERRVGVMRSWRAGGTPLLLATKCFSA